VWNCWTGALAHLSVARANALKARTSHGAEADAEVLEAEEIIEAAPKKQGESEGQPPS